MTLTLQAWALRSLCGGDSFRAKTSDTLVPELLTCSPINAHANNDTSMARRLRNKAKIENPSVPSNCDPTKSLQVYSLHAHHQIGSVTRNTGLEVSFYLQQCLLQGYQGFQNQ